jgi:hypothetical protein
MLPIRERLESVWTNRWLGVSLTIAGTILLTYFFYRVPSPGVSVAVMGGVAVILSLRARATGTEKAIWMLIITALLVVEIAAIRNEQSEQAKNLREERENFKKVLDDNNQKFIATIKRSNALMAGVSKTLSTTTGGNSFCFLSVGMGTWTYPDLNCRGPYPIYDLSFTGHREHFGVDGEREDDFFITFDNRVGNMTVNGYRSMQGVVPFSEVSTQKYDVLFDARNGEWRELLRIRHMNGVFLKAILIRAGFNTFSRSKIVYQEIDKGFPLKELEQDGQWMDCLEGPGIPYRELAHPSQPF